MNKQGQASFIGKIDTSQASYHLNQYESTNALEQDGGSATAPLKSQRISQLQTETADLAQSFIKPEADNSSIYLKSEQVFLNNLRAAKRSGNLSRDQFRQLRLEARRLGNIASDRYRSSDSKAELLPDSQWERQ